MRRALTPAVDTWQVGCLAYELLVGHPPYSEFGGSVWVARRRHLHHGTGPQCSTHPPASRQPHTHLAVLPTENAWNVPVHLLLNYDAPLTFPPHVSAEFVDFVTLALAPVPELRPTMADLIMHPWIDTPVEVDEMDLIIEASGAARQRCCLSTGHLTWTEVDAWGPTAHQEAMRQRMGRMRQTAFLLRPCRSSRAWWRVTPRPLGTQTATGRRQSRSAWQCSRGNCAPRAATAGGARRQVPRSRLMVHGGTVETERCRTWGPR